MTGQVKWFNVKNGYDFIIRHDTNEEVFVNKTAIIPNRNSPPRFEPPCLIALLYKSTKKKLTKEEHFEEQNQTRVDRRTNG
jgi:hypothetical protein